MPLKTYYCPSCGTEMKREEDVSVVYCPKEQLAFSDTFMLNLVNMAVDWRDSVEELHGTTSPGSG